MSGRPLRVTLYGGPYDGQVRETVGGSMVVEWRHDGVIETGEYAPAGPHGKRVWLYRATSSRLGVQPNPENRQ